MMRTNALYVCAAIGAILSGPLYADCTAPTAPDQIPDGNTATLDQMVATKKVIKEYDDAVGNYLVCIKQEHDDALAKLGAKASDKDKNNLQGIEAEKHNAAVAQLQSIADRFNEQIRVYKAKNDKKQ